MAASKTTKKRKSKTASRQQDTGNRFQTEILILVMFAGLSDPDDQCVWYGRYCGKCDQQYLLWDYGVVCVPFPHRSVWRRYFSDR